MSIISAICAMFTAGHRRRHEDAMVARVLGVKNARSAELMAVKGVVGVGCGDGDLVVYVDGQHKDGSLPGAIDGLPVRLFHQ